jgi:hypothetical protein|tara:strand:- start:1112 stop:1804 length:693 start_codon:yes stop_codon:yes gene_type:complete
MPCLECEDGKWRWGESGECQYGSKSQCEEANADYYAEAKLNSKGYDNASSLIEDDKIDKNSDWSFSSEDGNALLGEDGDDWENYAKWFLLVNEDANEDTKDRYKFPFGKEGKVYRSGLTAIRQRAGQFGYDDVFEAAGKLIDKIDGKEEASVKNELEYDHKLNFTKEEMETLHNEGELLKHIEKDGKEMDILFTYTSDELEEAYSNLTKAMLDDELDEYIDKLTHSIKQL